MTVHRAAIMLAGAAALAIGPSPAAAQMSNDVLVNILRECAKIDDLSARLACYDNNIRSAGTPPSASVAAPAATPAPAPVPAPAPRAPANAPASTSAQGFGAESVRAPSERAERAAPREVNEVRATVQSIQEREPGTYLLTLEDGAQWLFAEGVSRTYRVPNPGSAVEIRRGAIGSFLLNYDGQAAVRVRRVK